MWFMFNEFVQGDNNWYSSLICLPPLLWYSMVRKDRDLFSFVNTLFQTSINTLPIGLKRAHSCKFVCWKILWSLAWSNNSQGSIWWRITPTLKNIWRTCGRWPLKTRLNRPQPMDLQKLNCQSSTRKHSV